MMTVTKTNMTLEVTNPLGKGDQAQKRGEVFTADGRMMKWQYPTNEVLEEELKTKEGAKSLL